MLSLLPAVIMTDGSLSFRPTPTSDSHAVLALPSEIGRVETRNLTRRGAARLGLTSTETIRRCPWRLGYGSAPPLQGASRGRESLREFGTRRRRGPRCEQAVANLPEGRLDRSQDASRRLLRTFIGNLHFVRWGLACVSTHFGYRLFAGLPRYAKRNATASKHTRTGLKTRT